MAAAVHIPADPNYEPPCYSPGMRAEREEPELIVNLGREPRGPLPQKKPNLAYPLGPAPGGSRASQKASRHAIAALAALNSPRQISKALIPSVSS